MFRRRGRKFRTSWYVNKGNGTSFSVASVDSQVLLSSSTIRGELGGNCVLQKVLGDFWFTLTTNAASVAWVANFALIRVQVDDTGASPLTLSAFDGTGGTFDWIWQKSFMVPPTPGATATGLVWVPGYGNAIAGGGVQIPAPYWNPMPMIDTRAKRRLQTGQALTLYMDFSNSPAAVTAINVSSLFRILIKHT